MAKTAGLNDLFTEDTLEKGAIDVIHSGVILGQFLINSGKVLVNAELVSITNNDGDALQVDNVAVNVTEYTRPHTGEKYAAGLVAEYRIAGGVKDVTYDVTFKLTLDTAEVFSAIQRWKVVN